MSFLNVSLIGALVSLFVFFLTRSLRMHGWSISKQFVSTSSLLTVFTLNNFLFQTIFFKKMVTDSLFISLIISFIISVIFYFLSKTDISKMLSKLLLLNGILVVFISLSFIETFQTVPEPNDSFVFDNLSLVYQIPSITIIFFLISIFENKMFRIVSKNKLMYIVYNSVFSLLGILILFWPITDFYVKYLTLPFALIFGYIGFCFATHMFAHHTRHGHG